MEMAADGAVRRLLGDRLVVRLGFGYAGHWDHLECVSDDLFAVVERPAIGNGGLHALIEQQRRASSDRHDLIFHHSRSLGIRLMLPSNSRQAVMVRGLRMPACRFLIRRVLLILAISPLLPNVRARSQ